MTPRHRRRLGVLVGIALLSSPLLATAGSASPLGDKQAEAARLSAQLDAQGARLSALDEQYNRAVISVQESAAELAAAERDITSANDRFAKARVRLARHAVSAYVHGGSNSVVERLAQSDGTDLTLRNQYIETAAAEERDAIDALKSAREDLGRLRERLVEKRKAADAAAAKVAADRNRIEEANASLDRTYRRVTGEVAQLVAAERARKEAEARRRAQAALSARQVTQARASTNNPRSSAPRVSKPAPPQGKGAGQAVAVARAQIGKPYRWGGSGPDSFDCSGLTMYAWRAAGVSLPHSTYSQWAATPHISQSDLQPGDLVYFRGLNHMAIYSGGGMMIEAPHTGLNVREVPLRTGDFYGASRPG
jgi:cell wall-associated NlpC family hydrolase